MERRLSSEGNSIHWKDRVAIGKAWFLDLDVYNGTDNYQNQGVKNVARQCSDVLPDDPFGMGITREILHLLPIDPHRTSTIHGYFPDPLPPDPFGMDNFLVSTVMTSEKSCHPCDEILDGALDLMETPTAVESGNVIGLPGSLFSLSDMKPEQSVISDESKDRLSDSHVKENDGCSSSLDTYSFPTALLFALPYLGVKDLFSAGMVCKELNFIIQSDPLLWQTIHIEHPLNENLTDELLLQLTSRAQGNLHCLSLIECPGITLDGLRRVLERNRKTTELGIPCCARIRVEGLLDILRVYNKGAHGIKKLRISGLSGITQAHLKELKSLLSTAGGSVSPRRHTKILSPNFYGVDNLYLTLDDEQDIDVEICRKCMKLRLIYDCPVDLCQAKIQSTQTCRACVLCISRCIGCGRCVDDDDEFEETFSLELMCSTCYKVENFEGATELFCPVGCLSP